MCCRQVISTASFRKTQTKNSFQTCQKKNYKNEYVIYLMECKHVKQYDRNLETFFNIRLHKQRKDVKDSYPILV